MKQTLQQFLTHGYHLVPPKEDKVQRIRQVWRSSGEHLPQEVVASDNLIIRQEDFPHLGWLRLDSARLEVWLQLKSWDTRGRTMALTKLLMTLLELYSKDGTRSIDLEETEHLRETI